MKSAKKPYPRTYPKKPRRLHPASVWVTVVEVLSGTGVASDELGWREALYSDGQTTFRDLSERAAMRWWHQTDQSGNCAVTLRLEDSAGVVATAKVRVRVEVAAECVAAADNQRLLRLPGGAP